MKITYVGNRLNLASDGKSFNTENHLALTLKTLGHAVHFIQESDLVPGTLAKHVPDNTQILYWTRTWPDKISAADLANMKHRGIVTISHHLDKYTELERDGGLDTDPFWRTDYCFSPEGSAQAQAIFKAKGINQRYLPAGVFEPECYLAEPREDFRHDVVFVGGGSQYMHPEWRYRRTLVQWLQETYGNRFGKFGYPEQTIRGHELNQLYASAKVVVGDTLCKDFFDSHYFSDRQYEVTGRGGFLLTPYIPGITDQFVDRKEAVFYSFGNWQQLKFMIDYYLDHDDEREAIRKAGHERTKKDHTYTRRLESMFKVLRIEGAIL